MCKYCEGKLPITENRNDILERVYIEGNNLYINLDTDFKNEEERIIKINNCPMCGKKLEGN